MISNPYATLQISDNSPTRDVKKAYRKLASLYHPDKNTGDKKKFQEISEAYEMLKEGKPSNFVSKDFKPAGKRWYQIKSYAGTDGFALYHFNNGRDASNFTYTLNLDIKAFLNGSEFRHELFNDGETFFIPKGYKPNDVVYLGDYKFTLGLSEKDVSTSYIYRNDKLYRGIGLPRLALLLGTEITFRHINDKTYKLKIPPCDSLDDEKNLEYKMEGLGLYDLETDHTDCLYVYLFPNKDQEYDKETIDLFKKKGYYNDSYEITGN